MEAENPEHFAVRQYRKYKLAAGKTAKSILISCGARLAPFDIQELREIMSYDEMELDTFNQGLQKRLKNFAERYPECCYLSNSTKEGSETYIIQKGRLSLNLRPPYAKERIQKALETIQMAREEKSKGS